MDIPGHHAIQFLNAITKSYSQLDDFRSFLRSKDGVETVYLSFAPEIRQVTNKDHYYGLLRSEIFVDLRNGVRLGWVFYLWWNDIQWVLETSIASVDDIGYETIHEFPDRIADTLDGCIAHLTEGMSDLLKDAEMSVDAALVPKHLQ